MKTLKESLLDDIDNTLKTGDDELAKEHIYNLLRDEKWFNFGALGIHFLGNSIEKLVILKKKGKKWLVDVRHSIECYCPNGYITDGSFEFDIIGKDFIISENAQKRLKSLKYGPKLVNWGYCIMDCPKLKNLKYCPEKVVDKMVIGYTGINTLKYFPEYCGFAEIIGNKNLKDLKDTTNAAIINGARITLNGFSSSESDMDDCKWRFNSNAHFIYDN